MSDTVDVALTARVEAVRRDSARGITLRNALSGQGMLELITEVIA